jgi:hypothetical protein
LHTGEGIHVDMVALRLSSSHLHMHGCLSTCLSPLLVHMAGASPSAVVPRPRPVL